MTDVPAETSHEIPKIKELRAALDEVVAYKSLLSPDWSHVRRRLEELYRSATFPSRLTPPFPELCAYRLAHIMMRDAREPNDFLRILELLDEPCGQPAFGARPHLLRVAALHRLRLIDPESVGAAEIKDSFDRALQLADRPQEAGEWADSQAVTQRVTANLIEQTGYLLDLPFAGKIDPDLIIGAAPPGDWAVLIRGLPMIWMTEQMARLFYEESVKRIQPAIRFEWPDYPDVTVLGTKLKGKDAILTATLCLAEHEDDALWHAMEVNRGSPIGEQLISKDYRLNKHLTTFRDKIGTLADGRLHGRKPIEGTLGAVNLRFAKTLDHVGLLTKSAVPKIW